MGNPKQKNTAAPTPTPSPAKVSLNIRKSGAGTIVGYIFYALVIIFGAYLVITKPADIAPVLIQIAGVVLILFGIVESLVTYLNRK